MSESTHVAEFFETTLCLSIPLLLISQIMAYRYALWEPIERIAELEHEDFERWLENEKEYRGETNNDPDALPNSVDRNIKEGSTQHTQNSIPLLTPWTLNPKISPSTREERVRIPSREGHQASSRTSRW